MTSRSMSPPLDAQLLVGPSWLVQRIGQSWYVRVDYDNQSHWSEPYACRAIAESKLAEVRDAYVAHMERAGFGTVIVDDSKPAGDA
jgi:hypothetical protein